MLHHDLLLPMLSMPSALTALCALEPFSFPFSDFSFPFSPLTFHISVCIMADRMTTEQRHKCMSRIKSKETNTAPLPEGSCRFAD